MKCVRALKAEQLTFLTKRFSIVISCSSTFEHKWRKRKKSDYEKWPLIRLPANYLAEYLPISPPQFKCRLSISIFEDFLLKLKFQHFLGKSFPLQNTNTYPQHYWSLFWQQKRFTKFFFSFFQCVFWKQLFQIWNSSKDRNL